MHLVHRLKRYAVPLTVMVVGWILGSQVLRVCRLEWLTLLPNLTVLPHLSHVIAKFEPLQLIRYYK